MEYLEQSSNMISLCFFGKSHSDYYIRKENRKDKTEINSDYLKWGKGGKKQEGVIS